MSGKSNSDIYSEKKIASYDSLFKESPFAKPQEVNLTITAAHLYGQAYIVERVATIEEDPVYTRFTCALEEITKVSVNTAVKTKPICIECDSNVKGVMHRKQIIVPSLDKPNDVMQQIEKAREDHMKKLESAQQKERARKRKALEEERLKEGQDTAASAPAQPAEEKLPEAPAKKAEKKSAAKPRTVKSVKALDLSEIEASFKELQSIEQSLANNPAFKVNESVSGGAAPAPEPETAPEPVPEIIPEPETVTEPVSEAAPEVVYEQEPEPEVIPEPVPEIIPEPEPEPVPEAAPEPEIVPEPIPEAIPEPEPEPVPEAEPEVIPEPEPVPEAAPAPAPVIAASSGTDMDLGTFQNEVLKLKAMLDSAQISAEEFSAERKKLVAMLY